MPMKNNGSYNIGLDIGTNSVGWAVTDENSQLLKFKKKNMWGVRLFDEGMTAASTRNYRSNRRRLQRRKNRIALLQSLIGDEVLKVDDTFFIRMKESFFVKEEKPHRNDYILFNDKNYTDQQYYDEYPTIYHLRYKLITCREKMDIRLVYLALHHIIKYRGNFLYEGQNFTLNDVPITEEIVTLLELLRDRAEIEFFDVARVTESIIHMLEDKKTSTTDKVKRVLSDIQMPAEDKKKFKEVLNAIVGLQVDLSKIFELEEPLKIRLSEELEEEKLNVLQDYMDVIEKVQKIYSFGVLQGMLNGKTFISEAMIAKYEKHKQDLAVLKKLFKAHFPNEYNNMFRKYFDNAGKPLFNYVNYIGNQYIDKKIAKEDLYKTIKKILDTKKELAETCKEYQYCLDAIKNDDFLNLQNSRDNGAIPYQLHKEELIRIIDNQSSYYPVLQRERGNLIQLLEFRIPFYVGPLSSNPRGRQFAWVERKVKGEKVYPWNFEEVIDIEATAEKFIQRMTNKCTYLLGEDVLPKYSLLYSEFEVLNEINKIRVNGRLLSVSEKKNLLNTLFKTEKIIKEKRFKEWLVENQICRDFNVKVEGFQKEGQFSTSLTSYIDFKRIFGEVNERNYQMIEDIILWVTLFTEKDIIERKIKKTYAQVTDEQIREIKKLRYSGWGRLSRKLLAGITVTDNYNNPRTIMDYLRDTNMNLMQIISSDKLGFKKIIEKDTRFFDDADNLEEVVNGLPGSPAIKRGILQTMKVLEEIVKVKGRMPDNIFVEFAREDQESKRTQSRMDNLMKLYQKMKEESHSFFNEIAHLELQKKNLENNKLDTLKLFLYFIQNGKCMYTGEPLDIHNLSLYEVDHILPRSYIKDDSIDNLALVLKKENQRKADDMLLKREIIDRQRTWWNYLLECGLISKKKFDNLTRDHIDPDTMKGFIQRQLVETRQITKHVVKLIKACYPYSNIVSVKAQLCSDFRQQFNLYKCRTVNDFHHAHDAYLVSVIGNYILRRFPKLSEEFNYGQYRKIARDNASKYKFGFVISSMTSYSKTIDYNTGEVFEWNPDFEIGRIKKVLDYKDCFVSRKKEELTGEFYKQTIYGKNDARASIPLKKGLDVRIYGGYTGEQKAFYSVVEYKKKNKIHHAIVGIPIYIAKLAEQNETELIRYLLQAGYEDVKILKKKILKYQLIKYDGGLFYMVSDSEIINAKQLLVDQKYLEVINAIERGDISDINVELLHELYFHLVDKIKTHYHFYNDIADRLIDSANLFCDLSLENKAKFVEEMLKITQVNSTNANFKRFGFPGLGDRVGRMAGKNLVVDKIEFIDTSVTGMFETRQKGSELWDSEQLSLPTRVS